MVLKRFVMGINIRKYRCHLFDESKVLSPETGLHMCSYVNRSSRLEVFLGKGVLKICRKFTKERLCRSVISISKLLGKFIEIVHVFYFIRNRFIRNLELGILK